MFFVFNSIILFCAFVLQTTVAKYISFAGVKPDIVLLFVIYSGLFGGKVRGIVVGAVAGLLLDSMSYGVLGLNLFTKGLIGYVLGNLREKIIPENTITQSFFIFIASLIDGLLSLFILGSLLRFEFSTFSHLTFSFKQIIYNIILGPFFFFVISMLEKRFVKVSKGQLL